MSSAHPERHLTWHRRQTCSYQGQHTEVHLQVSIRHVGAMLFLARAGIELPVPVS